MKHFILILSFSFFLSCGKSTSSTPTASGKSDFLITENNSTELAFLIGTAKSDGTANHKDIKGLWRPEKGKVEEGFIITADALLMISECTASTGEKYYATIKLKAEITPAQISIPAQAAKTDRIELSDGSYLTCGENVEAMKINYRLSQGKLYIDGDQGEYSNLKILDLDELSHLL